MRCLGLVKEHENEIEMGERKREMAGERDRERRRKIMRERERGKSGE